MKKLMLVFLAAVAFSCGDNRSSERDDDYNNDNTELAEPDTATNDMQSDDGLESDDQNESDTTSTWDRDRDNQNQNDTIQ